MTNPTHSHPKQISCNNKFYNLPTQPTAIICIDGCENDYLEAAISAHKMPHLRSIINQGFRALARGALPSFTNVNNASIISGQPPSRTGISGNFFLNPESQEAIMMNDGDFLKCDTILNQLAQAGKKVAIVSAKDKLCSLLGKHLNGIVVSTEKAKDANIATNGIDNIEALVGPIPNIYSGEASIYVLKTGVQLFTHNKADFCYLTLSDYIQHKHAPSSPESLAFYAALDAELGKLLALGVRIGITADHGMNHKNDENGKPKIIFVESELKKRFGHDLQVICPITDPYVVHHGSLGGYVEIHLGHTLKSSLDDVISVLKTTSGISEVYTRSEAASKLELPLERIGDIIVLGDKHTALGQSLDCHELEHIQQGLRTHGSRFEETVPFIVSEPLQQDFHQRELRNFDIFEATLNGVVNTMVQEVCA